jgi:hypothetical protein
MRKLTRTELAAFREEQWLKQDKRCRLSGMRIALDEAVVDHCHKSGEVRGVLHRGVNSMLGKIENHRRIAGMREDSVLHQMLTKAVPYLARADLFCGVLYPLHKTEDEKRLARNAKARKTRAKRKAQ